LNIRLANLFRAHAVMIVLLALIAAVYLWWTWDAGLGQLGSDGPNYLMMAHHYAHAADADPVYTDAAAYSRFPPLYPLVLSWLGAADDLNLAHFVTTMCLLLALFVYYCWQVFEGIPPAAAALLMLLFAMLPGSWLLGLTVESEYLYLLLSLAALLSMSTYLRTRAASALYGAAILLAVSVLARSIGIALFAPFALICLRAPRREAALAIAASILPILAWYLLHHSRVSYVDALDLTYRTDRWTVLRNQLTKELPALRTGFWTDFALHSKLRFLADFLALLSLAGLLRRLVRLEPDAVYAVANLSILLVWPYPEEAGRFLWVLLPLLIAQPILAFAVKGGSEEKTPRISHKAAVCGISAIILVMTLPALATASDRYRSAPYADIPGAGSFVGWYGEDSAHAWDVVAFQTSMINSLSSIVDLVPKDDCVISTRPDLVNYFGRRRSYFPPLSSTKDLYFGRELRAYGCRFVYAQSSVDGRYPVAMYPLARLSQPLNVVFYNSVTGRSEGQFGITSMLVKID
jgi:hypothetical protein